MMVLGEEVVLPGDVMLEEGEKVGVLGAVRLVLTGILMVLDGLLMVRVGGTSEIVGFI